MANVLQKYFPMIRTREEILSEIQSDERLFADYLEWNEEQREEFLGFCTGNRGIKILYDSFFKEIMSPENSSRTTGRISVACSGADGKNPDGTAQ